MAETGFDPGCWGHQLVVVRLLARKARLNSNGSALGSKDE